jgi:Ca2+-binding RTX toxin-like protein
MMRRLLIAGLALAASLALVAAVGAGDRVTEVGDNVNITKLSGHQAEATIAIDPTNTNRLFMVSNGFVARRSIDGGMTWKSAGSGVGSTCCDNVSVWDEFGNLWLANINGALTSIPAFLSVNGGATFAPLGPVDSGAIDQPAIDAGGDSVWWTWNNNGTIFARGCSVTGLGTIPSCIVRQAATDSDTVGGQFGDIAVGPNGEVVVVYQSDTQIYANTDANGLTAGGFGAQVMVAATNVEKFDDIPAQDLRTIDAEANLAYDRSGGTNDGRLYLVYTNELVDESNNTDIFVRSSDDDGATWSAVAVKVNDDITVNSQFLPDIAVDQTTGRVFVAWLDARNAGLANDKAEYWGAVSTDGGATFEANFKISDGMSDAHNDLGDDFQFGDYTTVTGHGGYFFGVWPDNSNSTGNNPNGTSRFDIYTAKVVSAEAICRGMPATIVDTPGGHTINGTAGNDVIAAGDGDDTVNGMGGNDVICGEDDNDTINGGQGNDVEDGGDSNDTFDQENAPNGGDQMFGGDGTDDVDFSNRAFKVTVIIGGKAKSGEGGEKDMVSGDVEDAAGGAGNDKLNGNGSANELTGNAGKDKLLGAGGADTLNGMDGVMFNDTLDCGKNDAAVDTTNADAGDKLKNCP